MRAIWGTEAQSAQMFGGMEHIPQTGGLSRSTGGSGRGRLSGDSVNIIGWGLRSMSIGNRREGEAERDMVPKVNSEGDGGYWSSGEAEREVELEILNDIV